MNAASILAELAAADNLVPRSLPPLQLTQFKAAELRRFDGLLSMFFLRPVRCKFCWRRFYWFCLRGPE